MNRWIRVLAALALALPGVLAAQTYPAKPIRMIVGFYPGGRRRHQCAAARSRAEYLGVAGDRRKPARRRHQYRQ